METASSAPTAKLEYDSCRRQLKRVKAGIWIGFLSDLWIIPLLLACFFASKGFPEAETAMQQGCLLLMAAPVFSVASLIIGGKGTLAPVSALMRFGWNFIPIPPLNYFTGVIFFAFAMSVLICMPWALLLVKQSELKKRIAYAEQYLQTYYQMKQQ